MMKWLKRKNDIVEKVSIEESTEEFIHYFKEFVKDSDPLTIKKLIKFVASSIQGQLLTKCFYNDRNYADYINQVKNSLLLDLLDHDAVHNEKINISTTPIISCVWNNSRLMGAISKINHLAGNPFDGNVHSQNIIACMVKPTGLVIVTNGNHSVNSAIVHGEGEIIVNEIKDIKPLLEKFRFTGKEYVEIGTNKPINSKSLKNGSEPFVYELGLMFEMARILEENNIPL